MNTTDKIANAELEKLGFKNEAPKQDGAMNNFTKKKSADLFDMPDIPPSLDRRSYVSTSKKDYRHKQHLPKVVTGRSTPQKQDIICSEMCAVGSGWVSTGAETLIPQEDLDHIVSILSTNMGNIIEHAGLINKDSKASERLRSLLSAYLRTQTKHYNGSMYRMITVKK